MPDKIRPLFHALIFCATLAGMVFFVKFVADEVKGTGESNGEAQATLKSPTAQTREDLNIPDAQIFAKGGLSAFVKMMSSETPENFAMILMDRPAYRDAVTATLAGDYRLAMSSPIPGIPSMAPGVACSYMPPSVVFNYDTPLTMPISQRLLANGAKFDYMQDYNRAMVLQPKYPYQHLCHASFDAGISSGWEDFTEEFEIVPKSKDSMYVSVRDKFRRSDIRISAALGDLDAVRTLLDNGQDVDEEDALGMTALFYATLFRHEEMVRLLLEHGADPDHKAKPLPFDEENRMNIKNIPDFARSGQRENIYKVLEGEKADQPPVQEKPPE